MLTLPARHALAINVLLGATMAATRSHHFASLHHLPDASWAVFFLAGAAGRPFGMLAALLAEAVLIDLTAVTAGGVSTSCISPAYIFLLPAYGSLWLAGRWYAQGHSFALTALPRLGLGALIGAIGAELCSSGSFYFLSGRFTNTHLTEFGARLGAYFPSSLEGMAFWIGLASAVYVALVLTARYPARLPPRLR